MSTASSLQPSGAVVSPIALETKKPEGLWTGAARRLFRNRAAVIGLAIVIGLIFMAIFAPVVAPRGFSKQILDDQNAIPSWLPSVFTSVKASGSDGGYANVNDAYPFGADDLGRDILSRLVWGARISLSVAFIGPLVSLTLGITLGSIAGFYGGWVDNLIMRVVDLMYAFPSLLLIILMMAFFRSNTAASQPGTLFHVMKGIDDSFGGLFFIFIGIGITSWETMGRLTRAQVLSAREREYVMAAQSVGMSNRQILIRQILPNILGPLIVAETLAIPGYIVTEAVLSFIGLGVNVPTPSWGSMISDGAKSIQTYPNQVLFPALMLALAMYGFNFLGDGLRDALDPRTTKTS